jgi:hypothetical protein
VGVIYVATGTKVTLAMDAQPFLLLYFFAGIGLKSDLIDLVTGGRPLAVMIGQVGVHRAAEPGRDGRGVGTGDGSQGGVDGGVGVVHGRARHDDRLGAVPHAAKATRSQVDGSGIGVGPAAPPLPRVSPKLAFQRL